MRHSTEDEKQAYEQMLERMSVPLHGPKVWMVYRESGKYIVDEYDVRGIFSTYDKARAYAESQLTMKCYHYVGRMKNFHWTFDVDEWHTSDHEYAYLESSNETPPEIVGTGMTRPVGKDAFTLWAEYPDGECVLDSYGHKHTWYITEYEVDGLCRDM